MNQFLEAAGIALGAIWSNKLRSFLTVLGNIVAVTSIIAVVSLVQGLNEYVTNAIISDVGADNFTIQRMPVVRIVAERHGEFHGGKFFDKNVELSFRRHIVIL